LIWTSINFDGGNVSDEAHENWKFQRSWILTNWTKKIG
jgi:hypothetical protein